MPIIRADQVVIVKGTEKQSFVIMGRQSSTLVKAEAFSESPCARGAAEADVSFLVRPIEATTLT